MLNSRMLETAIGLVFVFFTLSLVASAVVEYLSAYFDRRGEHLKHVLFNLFDNDDPRGRAFLNAFVSHPMIRALSATNWTPTFSSAQERIGRELRRFRNVHDEWNAASAAARSARVAESSAAEAESAAARAESAAAALAKRQQSVPAPGGLPDDAVAAVEAAAAQAEVAAREAARAVSAVEAEPPDLLRQGDGQGPHAGTPDQPEPAPAVARAPAQSAPPAPEPTEAPRSSPAEAPSPDGNRRRAEQAIARAEHAAADAREQAKRARRVAAEALTVNRRLYRQMVDLVDVPKYIPDRTFADVVVAILTSDAAIGLVDAAASGRETPGPNSHIASLWTRLENAVGLVRGVASRLSDTEAKARVERCLDELDAALARARNDAAFAPTAIAALEAGTNQLRAAVAAVPDDALRKELMQTIDVALAPLHAIGPDILRLQRAGESIARLADSSIKTALSSFVTEAGEDLDRFKQRAAAWYNDVMGHASGWYKRNTQAILFAVGMVLCIVNNVDTVAIVGHLSSDPALRASASDEALRVVAASGAPGQPPSPTRDGVAPIPAALSRLSAADLNQIIEKSKLPLWWTREEWSRLWWAHRDADNAPAGSSSPSSVALAPDFTALLTKVLGLLLSTMAVSMGAPFWFDVLNKLVNVRLVGKRPEPTAEVDRAGPAAPPSPARGAA